MDISGSGNIPSIYWLASVVFNYVTCRTFLIGYCHGCGSEMIRARQHAAYKEETLASRLAASEPWTSRDVT